jgi:hypothetical protein
VPGSCFGFVLGDVAQLLGQGRGGGAGDGSTPAAALRCAAELQCILTYFNVLDVLQCVQLSSGHRYSVVH